MPVTVKTALSLVPKPSSYSILNSAGQTVYTSAVPEPEILRPVSSGADYIPGGPQVAPIMQASIFPVAAASGVFDFLKRNPVLILVGAAAVGLLLRKKRRK